MRVYLAARYSRHEEMRGYRSRLRYYDIEVTSRWINGEHELLEGSVNDERSLQFALDDTEDLRAADAIINFTDGPGSVSRGRGGRHVEFGYALHRGLDQYIIGPRENVFHWMVPDGRVYPDFDTFERFLPLW